MNYETFSLFQLWDGRAFLKMSNTLLLLFHEFLINTHFTGYRCSMSCDWHDNILRSLWKVGWIYKALPSISFHKILQLEKSLFDTNPFITPISIGVTWKQSLHSFINHTIYKLKKENFTENKLTACSSLVLVLCDPVSPLLVSIISTTRNGGSKSLNGANGVLQYKPREK